MEFKINEKYRKHGGIYGIKNEFGKLIYIGKALDFFNRYSTHCREINKMMKT